MIDRQKLEALLSRRFPGATGWQIAAAANAIMGLEDEWEEVHEADSGAELRVLRRRPCSDVFGSRGSSTGQPS